MATVSLSLVLSDACATDKPNPGVHGPIPLLQEHLVQSADDYRLLRSAERDLQSRERNSAFRALAEIFSRPWDSFTPIVPDRPVQSTYDAALQLLRNAEYQTRVAWYETMQREADSVLRNVGPADVDSLAAVSRRYPLTKAGLHALQTSAAVALSHGCTRRANSLLRRIHSEYATVTLPFAVNAEFRNLENAARGVSAFSSSGFAGARSGDTHPGPAVPWNESLWRWQENVWARPEAAGTLGGLTLPENRELLSPNVWQSCISDAHIVFRSPLSLSFFDKYTGRRVWWLETDTTRTEGELKDNEKQRQQATRLAPLELMKMDDLASITLTEDSLYFIDHFRNFSRESWVRRSGFGLGGIGNQRAELPPDPEMLPGGTRLVAVRFHPEPKVVWTTGDSSDFQYRIRGLNRPGNQQDDAAPIANEGQFDRQCFLGTPLAYGRQLFVLTFASETIWLNCLRQSSGRLMWRRPLLYDEITASGFGQSRPGTILEDGASICGISGDTLVSALQNGLLIGTDVADGRLLWATNLGDDDLDSTRLTRRFRATSGSNSLQPTFPPGMSDGRIIWAAPQGSSICCVDASNGAILWKTPRTIETGGAVEASRDNYAVSVTDESVVLIGTHHVRSLEMSSGRQKWLTTVRRQWGRAAFTERNCLIPQNDGTIVSIDSATGRKHLCASELFQNSESVIGSLTADELVICAATPVSLQVLPTASFIGRRRNEEIQDSTSPAVRLTAAQQALHSGRSARAIELLMPLTAQEVAPSIRSAAAELYADSVLTALAAKKYAPDRNDRPPSAKEVALLRRIPLKRQQQLRMQLFASDESARQLSTDAAFPLVRLLPDWHCRFDMAALSDRPPRATMRIIDSTFRKPNLLQHVEQVTCFPYERHDVEELRNLATRLRSVEQVEAAEQVLLSALNHGSHAEQKRLSNDLRSLRQCCAAPANLNDERFESSPSLTSADVTFRETLSLTRNSRLAELVATGRVLLDAPSWYSRRLFVVNRSLFAVDMNSGAVSLPEKLPAAVEVHSVSDSLNSPGLLPVTSPDHVGVVSLLSHGRPRLLWWKRLARDPAAVSELEIGPMGSGFMVVRAGEQLYCLHPLTGAILWHRMVNLSAGQRDIFPRKPRLTGDHRAIGILGANMHTCEVLRTSDGAPLSANAPNIPRGQIPLIAGRRLLYHREQQLELWDALSGVDLLRDKPPVLLQRNAQARMIADDRAVLVTKDLNITVLNLRTARVESECPIGQYVREYNPAGISCMERDGRLLVFIRDLATPQSYLSASSRLGEWRTDSGVLFCIDLKSGALRWHRPSVPAVMPEVHGDPSPFFVTWSMDRPMSGAWQLRLGPREERQSDSADGPHDSLVVRLYDSKTGRKIAEQKHFCPTEPLRCSHDADKKVISLETDRSLIEIAY